MIKFFFLQEIYAREDVRAGKVLIKAECLAHMRQRKYDILIILNMKDGDIIHANCRCEDGQGPASTCKHVAALCYALEDFVKVFILPEDVQSCTEKLETWNKPRDIKLPASPLYDVDFERKKFGKRRKERRELRGRKPEFYQLHQVCESDRSAVTEFLSEMNTWSADNGKNLLINTVTDISDPIETTASVNHLYVYMSAFYKSLEDVCSQVTVPLQELKKSLKVSEEEQSMIEKHTLLQSRVSDWYTLRTYRITGSVVHRICNYYVYKRSNPENIVKSIMQPSSFTSAAMRLGLEFEPKVLERYEAMNRSNNIQIKKLGLIIDKEYGFLASSPDSGIVQNGHLVGLVEVKTKISDKWSKKSIADCVKDSSYPLKSVVNTNNRNQTTFSLKENNPWYHQIQLQLFVCRSFAQFCDLAIYHVECQDFFCLRIKPSEVWVKKHLPELEQFFNNFMAPHIIEKHNVSG
ncbi:uncharacterized protein LOC132760456 [Ruditapes philippinarum]|uniref:uncharacterized protein LOC132760456 n=1 Tax=Ruditapes philippinarum TaxID=129788 RepID=UPI00295BCBF4|nr:uncharacterized protein LOC132760456 [Ruditapes philippinarum]